MCFSPTKTLCFWFQLTKTTLFTSYTELYSKAELDSKGDGQRSSTQPQLTVADLAKVCKELYSIRDKWQDLALELGIPVEKLDHIKATNPDTADCLRETVSYWLTDSPDPTWQDLTTALESRTVNEHELAARLKKEYCKAEGTSTAFEGLIPSSHFPSLILRHAKK